MKKVWNRFAYTCSVLTYDGLYIDMKIGHRKYCRIRFW